MAQTQRLLKAFGLFSAGSLVTYGALNCETFGLKQKVVPVLDDGEKVQKKDQKERVTERKIKDPKIDKLLEHWQKRLESWKAQNCVPGMVVGVTVKGKPVWTYATGLSDIENNIKCHENTSMRIASISKAVTSVYLMRMVEEGKLDLDKPIRDYLTVDEWPDKEWDGKKVDITLRQLASHTAGIRNYKMPESKQWWDAEFLSTKIYPKSVDALSWFKNDPLDSKPGSTYAYTTLGWTLISAVMESRLESRNFGPDFQSFIATQLGLKNTFLDENIKFIPNRSKYYFVKDNRLLNCPPVSNSCKWAGGGLVSTIPDLLQFGNLMLYSAVRGPLPGFLPADRVEEMWNPVQGTTRKDKFSGYGIGWCSLKNGTAKIAYGPEAPVKEAAYHSGAAVGASSILMIEPEKEIVVAIITNMQAINPQEEAFALVKDLQKIDF